MPIFAKFDEQGKKVSHIITDVINYTELMPDHIEIDSEEIMYYIDNLFYYKTQDNTKEGERLDDSFYFDITEKIWKQNLSVLAERIRSIRNDLLKQTDWTQLEDIDIILKNKWKTYRQDLRDITLQFNFPTEVLWPTTPE